MKGPRWNLTTLHTVHTEDGVTRLVCLLEAEDVVVHPEEGETLRHVVDSRPMKCPLSPRELDVLRHLSEGMRYKQIAAEMHLSVSTIRSHLHNVYGKLGVLDRAQAVLLAVERGWL